MLRRANVGHQAREAGIYESADLHYAAAHEHREEITEHRSNVSVRKVEYRPQPPDEPEHSRKLDDKLEGATDN